MRTLTLLAALLLTASAARAADIVDTWPDVAATEVQSIAVPATPVEEAAPTVGPAMTMGDASTMQALVALVASMLVALIMVVVKAILPARIVAQAGTLGNRLLPIVCLALGVALAVVNAWWVHVPIRSAEGWGLLQDGIAVGLGAIGVRSLVRTTVRGR